MKTITKNLLILVAMITAAMIVGCPQKSEPKAAARYTVTFDKNHPDAKGSMEQQTFEEGVDQKLTPNLFDLTNHDFKGWATSPDGDKKYIDQQSITVSANITLYAVWEETICTITFNKNADDAVGTMYSQTINNGVPGVLSENKFTRPNFEFLGWATSPDGEKVYDDKSEITVKRSTELYAVWVRNTVYVTFDKNDPNATGTMGQQSFGAGLQQSLNLNTFEKDGYHFTGWAESSGGAKVHDDGESITINSNITLYAMWEINQYTVTFDSNGGTGTMEPQIFSHSIAQNLTKNTFTRDGHTFVGWATSADDGKIYNNEASFTTTSDTTLYAVWEPNKYTVTLKNGSYIKEQVFTYGVPQKLIKNTFVKGGYTFVGWATSADGAKEYDDEASFIATSNTTLYAVWKPNIYTMTFNANGGTGTMEPQVFIGPETKKLSPNAFTRPGCTFIGWAQSADGGCIYEDEDDCCAAWYSSQSDTWYSSQSDTTNLTLYAMWSFTFGEWPQTIKANGVTISDQSKKVGMFTYYKGSDGAWYVQQREDAHPSNSISPSQSLYHKYSNGTIIGTGGNTARYIYFKVEPIKWRILEEKNGKMFLLAEDALMGINYYGGTESRTIGTEEIYPNNYMHSRIRAWLNGYNYQVGSEVYYTDYQDKGFLQTAFTTGEQYRIYTTKVDNSAESTLNPSNPYVCEDTNDKVFLLSAKEASTESYGFFATSTPRLPKPTDFALATRAYCGNYSLFAQWFLRSPSYDETSMWEPILGGKNVWAYSVSGDSNAPTLQNYKDVALNYYTVVPALWVYK